MSVDADLGSPRRQNHSCDPCRRSKRRCTVRKEATSCQYCIQIGRKCTFQFVAAQAAKKQRLASSIMVASSPSRRRWESDSSSSSSSSLPHTFFPETDELTGTTSSDEPWLSSPDYSSAVLSEPSSWVMAPYPQGSSATNISLALPLSDLERNTTMNRSPTPFSSFFRPPSLTLNPKSPVNLLNSKVTTHELDQQLLEVYSMVMGRCRDRFLSPRCNAFAESCNYLFDPERDSPPTVDSTSEIPEFGAIDFANDPWASIIANMFAFSPESSKLSSSCSSNRLEDIPHVTLLGLARFLDNFSPLYGNRVPADLADQDESTIIAVVRAFSLQWLPTSKASNLLNNISQIEFVTDHGTHSNNTYPSPQFVFVDAWFKAHSKLLQNRTFTSFRYILAVFIFQMIAVPSEAASTFSEGEHPVDILCHALRDIEELGHLVRSYCLRLPTTSVYRGLIETSMSIFKWHAYIRDTVASLLLDKSCVLPHTTCAYTTTKTCTSFKEGELRNDVHVGTCEYASTNVFRIYRSIIKLKLMLNDPLDINGKWLAQACDTIAWAIEKMVPLFQEWLDHLECDSHSLPESVKASSVLLMMFWNMAILCFVEHLEVGEDKLLLQISTLSSTKYKYRSMSVNYLHRIARLVEEFQVFKRVDWSLPIDKSSLRLVHANTRLVVATLAKGIKHTLHLNSMLDELSLQSEFEFQSERTKPYSVQPLVACLSAVATTVSGAICMDEAMKELLREHGDALMEYCA